MNQAETPVFETQVFYEGIINWGLAPARQIGFDTSNTPSFRRQASIHLAHDSPFRNPGLSRHLASTTWSFVNTFLNRFYHSSGGLLKEWKFIPAQYNFLERGLPNQEKGRENVKNPCPHYTLVLIFRIVPLNTLYRLHYVLGEILNFDLFVLKYLYAW